MSISPRFTTPTSRASTPGSPRCARPASGRCRDRADRAKRPPRYTAVAVKDGKNWPWEFSRVDKGEKGHADKQWERKFEIVAHALFRDKGKTREAFLWAKDESLDNAGYWFGDASYIDDKIKIARRDKDHLISRSAAFEGNSAVFGIITEEPDGVSWQESYNLAFDDLKLYCESQAAQGWRPDHFCYYGVGAKRLFGAIVIKDASKADWDVSWSLTTAEYEKELSAQGRGVPRVTAPSATKTTPAPSASARSGFATAIWLVSPARIRPHPATKKVCSISPRFAAARSWSWLDCFCWTPAHGLRMPR